jgi:predicted glutamine amidotransferase
MCRLLRISGRRCGSRPCSTIRLTGLTDQSRNAKEMADSSIAGDGWGIGWYGPTPARRRA